MPGILFPLTNKGDRSTTAFNKDILLAAAAVLPGEEALCEKIKAEKDWRHKYCSHFMSLMEAQVRAPLAKALESFGAGLARAHAMDFESSDAAIVPLGTVMAAPPLGGFDTATIKGAGQAVEFEVPFAYNNCVLSGPSLDAQLNKWTSYGGMEPDCAEAIKTGASKLDSIKDRTFVLIGAGSELCPLRQLLRAGATVAALATRKPQRWEKLIEFARSTPGTLLLPVTPGAATGTDISIAQAAGADLMVDTPAISQWVLSIVQEARGPVTIGTYLYVDGGTNVCVTVASDYIIEAVTKIADKTKVSFAWLGSPSTAHVIPLRCVSAMQNTYENARWWWKALFKTNYPSQVTTSNGSQASVFNGLQEIQGPNYAVAQHIRQWRAMLLYSEGFVVSAPMAPFCRTESVTHNTTLKAALDGLYYFPPLEAFHAETAAALLFAILVSDMVEAPPKLASPLELFTLKSFHGGSWRTPFSFDSLGKAAFLLGKVGPQDTPNK